MTQAPDVIVVGGGVIGCAVAFELARRSVPVLLLDRSLPGRASSASAGGLWPVGEAVGLGCGVIYHTARTQAGAETNGQAHGPESVPESFRDFLVQSNALFADLAGQLKELADLDIEYAPNAGLLFLIENESERAFVESVKHALPSTLQVELLAPEELARIEPALRRDLLGAALVPGEYQVNPMLLAEAFKRAAIRLGASFRPNVEVTGLRRKGDRILGVEIGSEFVPCKSVVNAAGAWAGRLAATVGLHLPVVPVRGQIVLTDSLPPTLNACLSASVCYLLQKAHGEVLIGSTTEQSGFDVAVTPDAIRALCRGAVHTVPLLRDVRVKRIWAGLRPGTPDELPILGPVRGLDGYFNATGGFRTGIVASPLTGLVVAQWVSGEHLSYPGDAFLMDRFTGPSEPETPSLAVSRSPHPG